MTNTTLQDFEQAGIAAMVRAGEAKQWFFGHFGAAMIAGTRLLREPDLPGPAALALSARLSDMFERHPEWYGRLDTLGEKAEGLDPLLASLRAGASRLRTSGHSTIYVTTALHALNHNQAFVTDRVLAGLIMLHESGRQDDPARYYGVADYLEFLDRKPAESGGDAEGSVGAFRAAIASIEHRVADRQIDGRHYFLTGEKIHLLTHAHAIATLEDLGLSKIAAEAMTAQRDLARLVEPSYALAETVIEPARCTPFDASFWEQEVPDPAHVIKVAEAVVAQVPRLPKAERAVALERIAGIWTLLGIR